MRCSSLTQNFANGKLFATQKCIDIHCFGVFRLQANYVYCLAVATHYCYTLFGALIGLLLVYIVDERWINFSTKAIWWSQVLKVVGGLICVLLVKSGLKTPLNVIFGESIGRSVRYMLIVIVAGILWPLTFKFFSRLGKKKEN